MTDNEFTDPATCLGHVTCTWVPKSMHKEVLRGTTQRRTGQIKRESASSHGASPEITKDAQQKELARRRMNIIICNKRPGHLLFLDRLPLLTMSQLPPPFSPISSRYISFRCLLRLQSVFTRGYDEYSLAAKGNECTSNIMGNTQ